MNLAILAIFWNTINMNHPSDFTERHGTCRSISLYQMLFYRTKLNITNNKDFIEAFIVKTQNLVNDGGHFHSRANNKIKSRDFKVLSLL